MNNFPIKLAGITTFLVSFISALFFYNVFYSNFIYIPIVEVENLETTNAYVETNICEIVDSINQFENVKVKTKATIWKTWNGIYLSPNNCTYKSDLIFDYFPYLDFERTNENNSELILLDSEEPFLDELDVEMTGIIKILHKDDGIKIIKLIVDDAKVLSFFRKFEPKGSN